MSFQRRAPLDDQAQIIASHHEPKRRMYLTIHLEIKHTEEFFLHLVNVEYSDIIA